MPAAVITIRLETSDVETLNDAIEIVGNILRYMADNVETSVYVPDEEN